MIRVSKYLVLFLFATILLTGCETTGGLKKKKTVSVYEIIENRKIEKNFTKKELSDALGLRYVLNNPFTQAGSSSLILEHDAEIISGANQDIFYVFKHVSKPTKCGFFGCDYGNGTLASWHKTFDEAVASLGKKELTQTEKLNQIVPTSNEHLKPESTTQIVVNDTETKSKPKEPTTTISDNTSKTKKTSTRKVSSYDERKYLICYGQMTKAHKARGFHQRNRSASILVKETVCKAYAQGDINNYEGKGL